jgi:hypothetical protein
LQLVQQWLTEAAMFTADGETVIPGELLLKKPVLLERGSFRPLTNPMLDMLERAQEQFVTEPALQGDPPVVMFEMTLRQLQVGDAIDHRDFLDRVDTLGALGKPVLISNFLRYHRLVTYLSRQTDKPIGLPIGLVRLRDVFGRKILHRFARRPDGIARPAFQKRRETLRLSLAGPQNRQAHHRGKHGSRAAPAPSLRASGRK